MFHDLVGNNKLDLYKALLLLVDVLPLKKIIDTRFPFQVDKRPVESGAIASRHWYKTACAWQAGQDLTNPFLQEALAVGLPGFYSARGDWYLAVAGNSRSFRLADQACDYLCSRRANYTRMHLGLGLPVRHVPEYDEDRKSMHTALLCRTESKSESGQYKLGHLTYGSLRALGQPDNHDDPPFRWLWRSRLGDYDLRARQWRRWLRRVLLAWSEFKDERRLTDGRCLEIYDLADKYFRDGAVNVEGAEQWKKEHNDSYTLFDETWARFGKLADLFVKLRQGGNGPSALSRNDPPLLARNDPGILN
jgi:hypothetical protein